jgi:glycosyltransferase involved in cell wall biosynthesis
LGLGDLITAWLPIVPILGRLGFATILIFRPIIIENAKPSLSIIIPTKNEKGNVENALKRLPDFGGARLEIVFVDGHSTDGTWEEITRLIPLYSQRFSMAAFQQEGDGKAQAVRLGFSRATKDLVVILDADLSTPPELLERFYDAYCSGLGDFINGNRLVYPTAPGSMATLNKLGNVFFAKTLSLILGTAIGDALCGTKFFARDDYHRFSAWRKDFGDHDPFGDFELLFPAAVLALGILDVPVRYQNRTYGTTNIRRFYHGWQLLKMAAVGMFGITLGQTKVLANKISLKTK